MPEIKQLSEHDMPRDPSKYLLIERFCEPAIGYQYRISGQGCDVCNEYTHAELEETCQRALELAQAWNISVVYLSYHCGSVHT
jgi:hypothetical protein